MSAVPTPGPALVPGALTARVHAERGDFVLDAELAVEPGEIVALVGPNGAGKSTLLHTLAGIVPLAEGVIRLGDRVLADAAAHVDLPAQARQVGLVPQQPFLFAQLSALENAAFGLRARGARARPAREQARRWLATLGVAGQAQQRAASLSGGQAQRVAVARVLATEPAYVLLDEPFAALDEAGRPEVGGLVRAEIRRRGLPAVLVTHDPAEARSLADRVVRIEAGRLIG